MTVDKAQSRIMTEQEFNQSPLKNVMSYQDYFMRALKTGSTFTFNYNLNTQNSNIIFNFGTNTIKSDKKTAKEELYEKLANIKNPEIREQVMNGLGGITTPSQEFIDMLIAKYDKKQAQFEVAWAEYQASKDNLAFYKKIMETLEKKYENTESNYEASLVKNAQKNFSNAELNRDILLSNASDIAHRVV